MKKDIEIKYEIELNRKLKDLPDFATDFIQNLEENSSIRTRIAYCKDLNIYLRFLVDELGIGCSKSILELTTEDIKDIIEKDVRGFLSYLNHYTVDYISTAGNKVSQVYSNSQQGKNRKIATLRTFYNYLSRIYDIDDPTKHINIKLNEKVEIKNSLSSDEIDNLVATVLGDLSGSSERKKVFHKRLKYRNANIILLFAYSGIRISELNALDINDISINEGTFIVTRKGGDQEKLYISDEILPYLKDYIEERKRVLDVNIDYKDALFLSTQKKRISTRQIREILKNYSKIAGYDNITPHSLRRSFGMSLYNQSGDIQLTADVLGHKSTDITKKHYSTATEERLRTTLKGFAYKEKENHNKEK